MSVPQQVWEKAVFALLSGNPQGMSTGQIVRWLGANPMSETFTVWSILDGLRKCGYVTCVKVRRPSHQSGAEPEKPGRVWRLREPRG